MKYHRIILMMAWLCILMLVLNSCSSISVMPTLTATFAPSSTKIPTATPVPPTPHPAPDRNVASHLSGLHRHAPAGSIQRFPLPQRGGLLLPHRRF